MHHTSTNQLRVRVLEEDTWIEDTDFIMQYCAWVLRTTVPANMYHAPGTLAFGMDMIYRHKIQIDWELHKLERIKQHIANNIRENRNRKPHEYKEGDLVLIQMLLYEKDNRPNCSKHAEGPYKVIKVFGNGTLTIQRGSYDETISIRRLISYYPR